ncbi:MAG: EAL domain-containing protein [Cycloclasticus sp.]
MFKPLNLALMSVRNQFILMMLALTVALVASYSVVVYVVEKENYAEASIQKIKTLSRALEKDYAKSILTGVPSSALEIQHKWKSFPELIHAGLETNSAESVLHYSKLSEDHETVDFKTLKAPKIINGMLFYKARVMDGGKKVGVVNYVVSIEEFALLTGQLNELLVMSIPIALCLAILMALWLQKVFVRPLKNLMATISTITQEANYKAIIPIDEGNHSEFAALGRSFNGLLERVQNTIKEVQESKAQAQTLAYYDELTGLPNRRLLIERTEYMLGIAKREKRYGSLLFMDLDNFKTLNDSRGHAAGDELLKHVALCLKNIFRTEDTIARLGGDEFVILTGYLEDSEEAVINQSRALMSRLQQALGDNFDIAGESYHITGSIGITTFPAMGSSVDELMKQADTAMYRAKEKGRDGFCFYQPEMQVVADARLLMEKELRNAIGAGELDLFYQPQVDEFGRILGAEALLRWFKKDGGSVSPAEFIPVAEMTGLIVPIGEWVLKKGFQQIKQWEVEGVDPGFRLSINISPFQFYQNNFIENVINMLQETGASASSITLEVTEGIVIKDIESTIDKMNVLTSMGFRVSMDDFGTGYSSLMYLKKLPLSELKIDQSFVRDLHIDKSDGEIAATIIAMAKNLNLDVVAEGVEEEEQLIFLRKQGCTIFQGYYFNKPMPSAELTKLLFDNLIML